jgi:dGTPase
MLKLASYASFDQKSLGRMYEENYESYLSTFQRDKDRVIHSTAFRRLEYKTQVFVNYVGDHYRNRLTHSIEVSQIARAISRALELNEDLAECIALCHDLGHPPFGHAGEDALSNIAKDFGGFDHNAQSLRILTYLEQHYAEFNGLNLSWESLEGIAKHNGPIVKNPDDEKNLRKSYKEINDKFNLRLESFPSLEAQVASLADDIAYISHDIDDGIRAGFFGIEELKQFPLLAEIIVMLNVRYKDLETHKLVKETLRRLMKYMINDLINETRHHLIFHRIQTVSDVRNQKDFLVRFSKDMQDIIKQVKSFLMERCYRHFKVNRMTGKSKIIIEQMFTQFLKYPDCLPTEWLKRTQGLDEAGIAEVVIDYIAGMTDRYAIEEYRKLFDPMLY